MGYLNNQAIEIDAILTRKGRELMAENPQDFKITKFALADDEVDYRLWNSNHTLGTSYYGEVIENMPVLEPSPNQDQMMKFKLISMDKYTTSIPLVTIGSTYVELVSGQTYMIVPQSINSITGDSTLGYTAVLSNNNYIQLKVNESVQYTVPSTEITSGTVSVVGKSFILQAKNNQSNVDWVGTVMITGNETGGRTTLNFVVLKS